MVLRYLVKTVLYFQIRDSHPLWSPIPRRFSNISCHTTRPCNPPDKSEVWALPCSLTATDGISYDFFSSGYLDVSVPLVSIMVINYQNFQYFYWKRCRIRSLLDQRLLTTPQHISPSSASFIGLSHLGIHHLLY